ncbi:hypothetical protein [Streptosporangium sp. CA-115845]|uniref:hypothetical protein n=1 Tax=Streptosporangium sp. CA-115845 TaxID=3240071 RepID=UPI003D9280F2
MRNPLSPRFHSHTPFDEFREALGWWEGRRWWSERDVVDAVVAAEEVAGWLADRRPYDRKHHKPAWTSAIKDFTDAVTRLGPDLQAALQPELQTAHDCLAGFPGASNAPDRQPPRTALHALQQRWADPLVLEAAWRDLLAACRDEHATYDLIAGRRDLFWRLAQFTGRHPRELSSELCMVLDGSAFDVTCAKVTLGDIAPAPADDDWGEGEQVSELSEGEILELCRRLLLQPPEKARHVVWLAFTNAVPPLVVQDIGPVTLYEGEWLRARLKDGFPQLLHGLPAELTAGHSQFRFQDLPEGGDTVLVRVDLGEEVFADAVHVARERIHALVGLARFRTSSATWRPLEGYLHAINGLIGSVGRFRSPEADRGRLLFNPVGRELVDLTPKLWEKLAHADKELKETVGAIHWWEHAQEHPSLSALILNVRVLELTATRVSPLTWTGYLDTYLKSAWIRATVNASLFRVVLEALADAEGAAADHHAELRSLRRTIETSKAAVIVNFDGVAAVQALPRLIQIHPLHTRIGRNLRQLASRLDSPAALATWCEQIEGRWEVARARLRRSRNAIAHGGPITSEAIAALDDLGRYLSAWSLSLLLDSSNAASDITQPHEEFRTQADTWYQGLRAAPDVLKALFPDFPEL